MNTYIANFGMGNWAWRECLERQAIAVMDDVRVHPFWQRGDRDGYVAEVQRVIKRKAGRTVIKPVASRWFNLNTFLMETIGDLWIHREKDQLWWTVSLDQNPSSEIIDHPRPIGEPAKIFVYYKRCMPWSSSDKKGGGLRWMAIHPKAREFLFTEGTFQKLSSDNALYAQALIEGAIRLLGIRRASGASRNRGREKVP